MNETRPKINGLLKEVVQHLDLDRARPRTSDKGAQSIEVDSAGYVDVLAMRAEERLARSSGVEPADRCDHRVDALEDELRRTGRVDATYLVGDRVECGHVDVDQLAEGLGYGAEVFEESRAALLEGRDADVRGCILAIMPEDVRERLIVRELNRRLLTAQ